MADSIQASDRKFLVTGGMGCLGAWTLYHLHQRGEQAVSFDLSDNRARLRLLLPEAEQDDITFIQGDLTDTAQVRKVVEDHGISHIIHLAALQVPFCRDNPPLGAHVNVTGTINIFEAARHAGITHLSYASSIAVYGPPSDYPQRLIPHDAPKLPRTLYGVYKVANEGSAAIYWRDHSISSTALRPYTVYGVGRDQGITSEPTKALAAVSRGEPCHISFGGTMQFHWASDVAQQFITAALQPSGEAVSFNLGSSPVTVRQFTELVKTLRPEAEISCGEQGLPFPEGFEADALHAHADEVFETPLAEGIKATLEHFERLST
ncbi:MAG: NAD-dependent epimerase/dehydratase family protein [Deinococcota bacterium]